MNGCGQGVKAFSRKPALSQKRGRNPLSVDGKAFTKKSSKLSHRIQSGEDHKHVKNVDKFSTRSQGSIREL